MHKKRWGMARTDQDHDFSCAGSMVPQLVVHPDIDHIYTGRDAIKDNRAPEIKGAADI